MRTWLIPPALLLMACVSLRAADSTCAAKGQYLARTASQASAGDPNIDVTYYRLAIRVFPATSSMQGVVRMTATVLKDSLASVSLDLSPEMTLDSVRLGTATLPVTRYPASFVSSFPSRLRKGTVFSLDMY